MKKLPPLSLLIIASGVLVACCRFVVPGLTWLPLACFLGTTCVWIARQTGDVGLMKIVGASFVIRCVLAVTLFWISSWHMPILQSLHQPGGLWTFGGDGLGY